MSSSHDCRRSTHRRPLSLALRWAILGGALGSTLATATPPVVPLFGLDGRNGFRLEGTSGLEYSGSAVSLAGDINGDGIDDLII
ncbi:MAG: hypothetical protein KDI56_02955, partial [Xanthomonadales bacterium]|nr:hypothetical protein [Xanthomonadales bacterium]